MSIPEPAPAGGANIRPGQPQPKGRPTDDAEVICPVCTHHRCVCDDPDRAAVADFLHEQSRTAGFPLPTRVCFRLAGDLRLR
jgi:hypothetical protein